MRWGLALLPLLWAAMLFLGGTGADRAVLAFLHAGGDPATIGIARIVTDFGGYTALIPAGLIGAAILAWRRDWTGALLLAAIPLSGRLLVELQKGWIGRLRPEDQDHLVAVQSHAFPSGHAANSMMVLLSLALLLPRTEAARRRAVPVAILLSLAIGLTRPVLGVHWPSDVIGGWAFGLFWMLLLTKLAGRPLRSYETQRTDCWPASPSPPRA